MGISKTEQVYKRSKIQYQEAEQEEVSILPYRKEEARFAHFLSPVPFPKGVSGDKTFRGKLRRATRI